MFYIAFVLPLASIVALFVAYFSLDWKIFISILIVSSLLILATFFLYSFFENKRRSNERFAR